MMYQSCEQIDSDLRDVKHYNSCVNTESQKMYERRSDGDVAHARAVKTSSADAIPAPQADVLTNIREAGVDEADFVKVSADQIFVANSSSSIQVIERATKKLTGTLHLSAPRIQPIQNSRMPRDIAIDRKGSAKPEMFVTSNRLVVLQGNQISVYRTSANAVPLLLQSRSWEGIIQEARLVGERLVLVSSEQVSLDSARRGISREVSCGSVVRPRQKIQLDTPQMTRVSSVALGDLFDVSEVNHVGSRKIYMTPKSVYMYSTQSHQEKSTLLSKMSISADGKLSAPVEGFAKGRIKDVWALSELPTGELAVASTTGQLFDNSARNHFEVLSEKNQRLEKIGETEDYGLKEDIRSVRFVGNIAYVVTFKKTDPLYAIDVSKASAPRILGELKIPGFSTYMHPLSSTRLIGLGFDATEQGEVAYYQGLQLSLFDTSDPMKMARKDVKILGERGTSSAATTDHKAFYLDQAEGVLGFPISEIANCKDGFACTPRATSTPLYPAVSNNFSGAVLYKISEDSLGSETRITHTDLMSHRCKTLSLPNHMWWESSARTPDIQRIFKLAGEIVTISQGALKSFRWDSKLEQTGSASWTSDCDYALSVCVLYVVDALGPETGPERINHKATK
jgi:uncharacterized secreted protein with C-terminal beta-propeller domain